MYIITLNLVKLIIGWKLTSYIITILNNYKLQRHILTTCSYLRHFWALIEEKFICSDIYMRKKDFWKGLKIQFKAFFNFVSQKPTCEHTTRKRKTILILILIKIVNYYPPEAEQQTNKVSSNSMHWKKIITTIVDSYGSKKANS
jgi:hypothetical protein